MDGQDTVDTGNGAANHAEHRPADRTGAMSSLYRREHLAMVRLATLLLSSAEQGEEVVHDAFTEVGRRWDTIDRPGAYLRRCVVNGCRQVLRRRAVEDRHRATVRPAPPELPVRLVELHDVLGRLSERQRTVVVLRYLLDLPDREIADLLDVRPVTVRSLARRALIVLRRELTDPDDTSSEERT